jgi:hypothetical protein
MIERDLQHAMEAATGARSAAVTLSAWPNVGRIDLQLPGRVGLELKWCRSGDTLANCAWDIAKLATALRENRLAQGMVVAGAPAAHWNAPHPGVELFEDDLFESEALVSRYASWWRFWCNDVSTRPIRLPAAIAVSASERLQVDLGGTGYELRVAQVTVADSTWRQHVCPHRWRNERCRPRPWDPEGWGGVPPETSAP